MKTLVVRTQFVYYHCVQFYYQTQKLLINDKSFHLQKFFIGGKSNFVIGNIYAIVWKYFKKISNINCYLEKPFIKKVFIIRHNKQLKWVLSYDTKRIFASFTLFKYPETHNFILMFSDCKCWITSVKIGLLTEYTYKSISIRIITKRNKTLNNKSTIHYSIKN